MNNSWKQQLIIKISINPSEGFIEYCLNPIKHTYLYKWHKLNGPAVIYYDGSKKWFKNDKLHNHNGPATLITNGYKTWRINDKLIKLAKYG